VAKQEEMTFLQFQKKFNSEEACHEHLFQMKWSDGFECPRCKHNVCFVISTRTHPLYECKQCHHQTTVTVGTLFEKTRIRLSVWFLAIYWEAQDKRGISATYISRELEVSYPTAWLMLHKIRKAMADRDEQYILKSLVEIDDFFIGAPTKDGKRGRGTDKNQVLVALSKNNKGYPLYLKMEVIEDMKKETVIDFVTKCVEKNARIQADGHRSFPSLETKGYKLEAKKYDVKKDPEHLKWMHTAISNLKSFVSGTFHGLDSRHLQSYLDEYCFRYNRRNFTGELFNRLLYSCVLAKTLTYSELT